MLNTKTIEGYTVTSRNVETSTGSPRTEVLLGSVVVAVISVDMFCSKNSANNIKLVTLLPSFKSDVTYHKSHEEAQQLIEKRIRNWLIAIKG